MVSSLPSTSSGSSRSDLTLLEERIPISALEALVCHHAVSKRVTVQTPPLRGSFNLVYPLLFPDGRKWVARIPDPASSDMLILQSTVHTMCFISKMTHIPIPAIHAYDISSNNELGMPYMLMEFVEGVPLSDIWKDKEVVDDAARRRIFEQVASHMSQLNAFEFDKIGDLQYDKDSETLSVGPYRRRKYTPRSDVTVVEESGPFTTAYAYFSHLVQSLINSPHYHKPILYLLRILAFSLPDPLYDGAPFVLSHPDFDSQNVLVDPKTFTVTGFIDWDGVCVGPRLGGFSRYPAWITRDWDPFAYRWREPEPKGSDSDDATSVQDSNNSPSLQTGTGTSQPASSDTQGFVHEEESPDALQRHRDLYLSIYSKTDPKNADITRQSHIFEALEIALLYPEISNQIVGKLCTHVFDTHYVKFGALVAGLEDGDWLKSLQRQPGDIY